MIFFLQFCELFGKLLIFFWRLWRASEKTFCWRWILQMKFVEISVSNKISSMTWYLCCMRLRKIRTLYTRRTRRTVFYSFLACIARASSVSYYTELPARPKNTHTSRTRINKKDLLNKNLFLVSLQNAVVYSVAVKGLEANTFHFRSDADILIFLSLYLDIEDIKFYRRGFEWIPSFFSLLIIKNNFYRQQF